MTLCPYLPECDAGKLKRHGLGRGAEFYEDALRFAQGFWMEGKPAQAILQINKAFSADLCESDAISPSNIRGHTPRWNGSWRNPLTDRMVSWAILCGIFSISPHV